MTIPDYQTLMRPVLRLAAERERPIRDCIDLVADEFALSPEEREALLPSGKQTTLANRVHWAVTYMVNAGLLQRPRRGRDHGHGPGPDGPDAVPRAHRQRRPRPLR